MKVLWLSNIQTPVTNTNIGCSWIGSLESELSKIPDIHLGISFNSNQPDISKFTIRNTTYFPIKIAPAKSKFKKTFNRYAHKLESDDIIQSYLDIIQEFKPDLIHIFGTENEYGLVIPKTTIPCIIHLQGNLAVIKLKWFSGISSIEIFKYSKKWPLLKGYGLFHDYFFFKEAVKREHKITQGCHYYMGRTDWDRRVSSVLSPDSKYFHCDEIMRPGFYLHHWQPPAAQTNYIILSIIRKHIFKGLETIFECKKILNQNFPGNNIIWKIVGITEEDELAYLVGRKCKAKFKNSDIQLLGPLNENEIINEMLKADLFVHPSHIENSPNSVCEAMLCGMPVIATNAGGTPSIITDKKEGLLVQDGDPYALAGAIIELKNDGELANSYGENARNKSLIRNDPKKIVSDVLNIYSSILSKR
jgi:glycosyltransferase involved in cell wall biosynthesis